VLMNAYNVCSLCGYFVAWLLILYQWKNSEKILNILKMLHEVDQHVSFFNLKKMNIFSFKI
jgi:hypothetical protein